MPFTLLCDSLYDLRKRNSLGSNYFWLKIQMKGYLTIRKMEQHKDLCGSTFSKANFFGGKLHNTFLGL